MMAEMDSDNARSFGQAVRRRRIELGLTQEELADRVGDKVRQSDISRLERGYVMLPRRDRLEALAAALEVTPGYLLMHSGWITQSEVGMLDTPTADGPPAAESQSPGGELAVQSRKSLPETHDSHPTSHRLPETPSALNDAIMRAHQVSRETGDILRRTATTIENARRTRRK